MKRELFAGACDPGRRDFLTKLAVGAFTVVPAAALVSACGQRLVCNDMAGLKPDEQTARSTNQYVDASTDAAKRCDNCEQFEPAAPDKCGGCKVLKGPVHPLGYCKLWVMRT